MIVQDALPGIKRFLKPAGLARIFHQLLRKWSSAVA